MAERRTHCNKIRMLDELMSPAPGTLSRSLMPIDVRPPAAIRLLPRRAARAVVKIYRVTLSPLVGFQCRHLPTCSQYSDEAMARFGLWAGGWMTLARLSRCHPWGTSGLDFVPEALPSRARWYLPWRYGRWRGANRDPAQQPVPGA